jgi:hypothetical protein
MPILARIPRRARIGKDCDLQDLDVTRIRRQIEGQSLKKKVERERTLKTRVES